MNKILSIVIPVFNKYNFTKSCLNDLSKLPSDHEIIVVDNGSIDETQSSLENSSEIKYVRNDCNRGFAFGCNFGYKIAKGDNVLFLNNDIRVKSNHDSWTQLLLKHCVTSLVGPTMGQLDNQLNFVQEANKILSGNSYMSGWCLASSKNIWDKLEIKHLVATDYYIKQIFSQEYGLAYFEDTDLSFRARKLGILMEVVDVPVVHFGQQTSKQLNTRQLYKTAREIFVRKWQNKL